MLNLPPSGRETKASPLLAPPIALSYGLSDPSDSNDSLAREQESAQGIESFLRFETQSERHRLENPGFAPAFAAWRRHVAAAN